MVFPLTTMLQNIGSHLFDAQTHENSNDKNNNIADHHLYKRDTYKSFSCDGNAVIGWIHGPAFHMRIIL